LYVILPAELRFCILSLGITLNIENPRNAVTKHFFLGSTVRAPVGTIHNCITLSKAFCKAVKRVIMTGCDKTAYLRFEY